MEGLRAQVYELQAKNAQLDAVSFLAQLSAPPTPLDGCRDRPCGLTCLICPLFRAPEVERGSQVDAAVGR